MYFIILKINNNPVLWKEEGSKIGRVRYIDEKKRIEILLAHAYDF